MAAADQAVTLTRHPLDLLPVSASIAGVCTAATDDRAAPAADKRFATLRARAALAGFTLCVMTETDGLCFYLLSRWGMSRTLADLGGCGGFPAAGGGA